MDRNKAVLDGRAQHYVSAELSTWALCNETESHEILVQSRASDHDPGISLDVQLERVKEVQTASVP